MRAIRHVVVATVLVAVLVPTVTFSQAPASAAGPVQFVVDSTNDTRDLRVGVDGCADADGNCTLRAALDEANGSTGPTTIIVPPGHYVLGDDLDVERPTTIVGAGGQAPATVIDGQLKDRVFEVSGTAVSIQGLVITRGTARLGGGVLVRAGAELELVDSHVTLNKASDQGGAIDNSGALVVRNSTLASNEATKKGGGIHNAGTLSVVNSTLYGNSASSGGGIVTTGDVSLTHVTITANRSTNKLGGGVQRVGGTTTIVASIIADNAANSTDAKDCSGSPFLSGLNLIGNVAGCNPTGTIPLTGYAGLVPLADNGGPTPTVALQVGGESPPSSPALDAIEPGTAGCTVDEDQRGVPRPSPSRTGVPAGCDLGAFEVERFNLRVELGADVDRIGAGAAIVPADALSDAVASPSAGPEASPLRSVPLRSVAVEALEIGSLPLRSVTVEGAPLRSVPLRSVPLRSILLAAPLRSVPLRSVSLLDTILLSEIQLTYEGAWDTLLAGTPLAGVPLQTLTLADLAAVTDSSPNIQALTLADVDLSATRLGALSLVGVLLGPVPLRSVGLDLETLCGLLGQAVCAEYTNLIDVDETSLLDLEIMGAPLRSVPLRSVKLAGIDLSEAPLRSVFLTDLAPGSLPTIVDLTVCGAACTADGATLGHVPPAAFIGTMADLLLAIVGPDNIGWEEVDLTNGGLAAVAAPEEPDFTYTIDLRLGGAGAADVDVALTLPEGFVARPSTFALDGDPVEGKHTEGQTFTVHLTGVSAGEHRLTVEAWAGVVLGTHTATVQATATIAGPPEESVSATDTFGTLVVEEAFEEPVPADDHRELVPGSLHIAHISDPGDVDLYSFEVDDITANRGATISIHLGNLGDDFDLALYGPPAERLRGPPTEQRDLLPDHLADLDPGDDALTAEPTADVPQALTIDPAAVLQRVGGRRETAAETIEGVPLREGTYWVQVSSANGATSEQPYVLRARVDDGTDRGECSARPLGSTLTNLAQEAPPAGVDTLFVVNDQRFLAAYPATGPAALDALEEFAGRDDLGFVGHVLHLDRIAAVQSAYGRWEGDWCSPAAANDVVRAIASAIDDTAAARPDLAHIVLVGEDAQIPMARVPDSTVIANERSFADEFNVNNELVSALNRGFVLSDNPYATRAGIAVNDHELYVPELAVGRLVETPDDIRAVLSSFANAGGALDPTTALVTGYDFLADGARAVAGEITDAGLAPTLLIDEPGATTDLWDRAALAAALGDLAPQGLASVNAHFDHYRALPSVGDASHDESDLFVSSEIAAVRSNLLGALLFSMGCHSGLNMSDLLVGMGPGAADWAQTFAGAGAHWVGNTGYGYGDTETVALSEELMTLFARRLVAGDTAGVALAVAKQHYVGRRPLVSSYDEKVVQEAVLYGLPMLKVAGGDAPTTLTALASAEIAPAPPPVEPLEVDPFTGFLSDTERFDFTLTAPLPGDDSGLLYLAPASPVEPTYYHVDGGTLTQARRPIQPLTTRDVTFEGDADVRAEGFLVTTLSSEDVPEFEPVFFSPTVDLGAHEPDSIAADATFPSTMAAVTSTSTSSGRRDQLVVVPGQFRRTDAVGQGTQRLFTHIGGTVYYRSSTQPQSTPVSVSQTRAFFESNRVRLEVETDGTAKRVYVLYKPLETAGGAAWQGLDLVFDAGTDMWIGHGPAAGKVEYIVQVVGEDGRVFRADAKGDNFESTEGAVGELVMTTAPSEPSNGWHTGLVRVTLSHPEDANAEIYYSVDGDTFRLYADPYFEITGNGAHRVFAFSTNGYSTSGIVKIDSSPPTVTASVDAPGVPAPAGWNQGAVDVSLVARDTGGSGLASLTYWVDGEEVPAEGTTARISVSTEGTTVISARARDLAGNLSTVASVTVQIDSLDPATGCGAEPDREAWYRTNVTVSCTPSDATSGISGTSSFVLSTNVAAGGWSTSATTSSQQVCDVAGNCTTAGPFGPFKIDLVAPTASITSPAAGAVLPVGSAATAAFSCADIGSGIDPASCKGRLDGADIADGGALPTTTPGTHTLVVTATDLAGNSTSVTRTFEVFAYRICAKYDETQANLIGSTIPVKVQLCDESGRNISTSSIQLTAVSIDNGAFAVPPNYVGNTNFGDVFRFGQKSYIYNLDTGALAGIGAGDHTLHIAVDGNTYSGYAVGFRLR